MADRILELNHITKTFPGVKALDDVHFDLKPGEIHALIGENGAGQVHAHQGDHGRLPARRRADPFRRRAGGDPQHGGLPEARHRGDLPARHLLPRSLRHGEHLHRAREDPAPSPARSTGRTCTDGRRSCCEHLDADFDPRAAMGNLSVAQQQIVEIAKALSTNARIIIMDEPTAPLTNRESEDLYRITEGLRDKGVSIIFISHRMEDMYRLASRVTVFRDARYVGTWNLNEVRREDLIMAMVGREITQFFPKRSVAIGEEILRVEGLSRTGYFKDVSFSVHKGEILAITGLIGAGRTEVCEAIYGVTQADSGRVFLDGEELHIANPCAGHREGHRLPARGPAAAGARAGLGAFQERDPSHPEEVRHAWAGCMPRQENTVTKELAEKLEVRAGSVFDLAATLSGGNQQKIIVAKLLHGTDEGHHPRRADKGRGRGGQDGDLQHHE